MPGGAIDPDYPLAFNIDLKITTRYQIQSAEYKEKQKTFLQINTWASFTLDVRPTWVMIVQIFKIICNQNG